MRIRKIILLLLINVFFVPGYSFGQLSNDITKKNEEAAVIKAANVKSRTIWEYHYVPGSNVDFRDSGYKSFYFGYDNAGRITDYTKYHIFSDLTVRETYRYGKTDKIETSVRYNSANDMIETIDYKYKTNGSLKKEIHTAYFNGIRPGVYFSILASISDGELFAKLQDEIGIEPRLESYTINVNISDPNEENQYIVIGDESDASSPRYSWSQLSMESQKGLLSYQGPNRKEHTYINKNISNVDYKYDKNSNLVSREVLNTANDLIEKESYKYDANNRRINYYKFNESGKISSMESYNYDAAGKISETIGLDPGGKLVSRLIFKYDENNNLSEKTWLNSSGEINIVYKYSYDKNNRITEEIKYRGENEKESRITYEYNENGVIAGTTKYDTNDNKEKLIKYIYTYY